jgi:acyl-CoA thioesterase-1
MEKLSLNQFSWFALLALFASNVHAQTILVFGDSLSAGYGISREASWVSLLQKSLQQSGSSDEIVNASVSGETTSGGVRRLENLLQKYQPSIVILELGANDGLRGMPIQETERNLSFMIQQASKSKAKVLLLGMRLPPNYGIYSQRFGELYPKLAKQYGIKLVPFMLEKLSNEHFQADNLHPTAAAQALILQTVLPSLKSLF